MLPADKLLCQRLGARLRELRETARLTQEQVGERAGFSGKYISEIEKGIRDVPISTLRAVVEHGLGLAIDAAFGGRAVRNDVTAGPAYAHDVQATAEALAGLPLGVRRPFAALAREIGYLVPRTTGASRAAEPARRPTRRR
jgi:transcriptional regulator with XRE-family HTH domain